MLKNRQISPIIVGIPRGNPGVARTCITISIDPSKLRKTDKKPMVCISSNGLCVNDAIPRKATDGEPICKPNLVFPERRAVRL